MLFSFQFSIFPKNFPNYSLFPVYLFFFIYLLSFSLTIPLYSLFPIFPVFLFFSIEEKLIHWIKLYFTLIHFFLFSTFSLFFCPPQSDQSAVTHGIRIDPRPAPRGFWGEFFLKPTCVGLTTTREFTILNGSRYYGKAV